MKRTIPARDDAKRAGDVRIVGAQITQRVCAVLLAGLFLCGITSSTHAGPPPSLTDIQPRGLQIGSTTRVVVTGQGLDDTTSLVLPLPGAVEASVLSASGDKVEMHVRVAPTTPAGIYPLRVATDAGVSAAQAMAIDGLAQLEFRQMIVALPVALHGRIQGSQVLQTKFPGRSGQRLVVDLEAQRLGSKLRPSLRLFAPDGRLLTVARMTKRIGGDARLDVSLPSDGLYRLELQDIAFSGPSPGWFRLKIGDLKYADGVFPLAIPAGTAASVEYVSTNISAPGRSSPTDGLWNEQPPVTWPRDSGALLTGAAPRVRRSWLGPSEWTEHTARQQSQTWRLPVGINGRLSQAGEVDEYTLHVSPGEKIHVEVHAERWGSPLDAVLTVAQPDGTTLVRVDDQSGSADPAADVDIPADVSQVSVRVSSLVGHGGEAYVYRLSVSPSHRPAPLLQAEVDCLNLSAGSHVILPVQIDHRGTPRALQLAVPTALDDALTISPVQLDATDEVGLVEFRAAESARGLFRVPVLASVLDDDATPPVHVLTAPIPGAAYQPDWRHEFLVAINEPASLRLDWSTPRDREYLALGEARPLSVQIQRGPDGAGPVRLSLISSQPTVTKDVDRQQVVDDERNLRLAQSVIVPNPTNTGDVTLVVPTDLPVHPWSFALRADLLAEDQQQVLATAYTPLRRWPTIVPLALTLEGATERTVRAGDPAGVVLRGRVQRHADFKLPLQIRLQGLAENDPQPSVTLSGDERDFELTLIFAKEMPAREIKEVRVVAAIADPNDANRGIRSLSDSLTIQLQDAEE